MNQIFETAGALFILGSLGAIVSLAMHVLGRAADIPIPRHSFRRAGQYKESVAS